MIKQKNSLLFILLMATSCHAMVFDNRYLPLFLKPFPRREEALSHFRLQPFFMKADRAQAEDEGISIPDLDGRYDLVQIGKALVDSKILESNPFRSDLQAISRIPFRRHGRIDAQGMVFLYEAALSCNFSLGMNFLFMHVNSSHEMMLDNGILDIQQGDRNYLFALKEKLDTDLGVVPPLFSKTGFGDFDFYVKWAALWDYIYKVRRIELSLKVGGIAPTSASLPLNNPAAIPIGGSKHWGIYASFDGEFELKEDLSFGLMFRVIKRFPRTSIERMPVLEEPSRYGAVTGPLRINPGFTFVFNPYISIEGIREGLGVKVLYTLVAHLKDNLIDERANKEIAVNLANARERSSWGMEYVTIGAFYDTAKYSDCRTWWKPTFSLYWDIPLRWQVSKRSSRTQAVSLMIETDF